MKILATASLLASVIWLAAPAGASEPDFELEGSWFVVAHYTDDATNNPDAKRWLDEVWIFEKKGSRLQWTKYPLVVFDDKRGRFETFGRNSRSRVLDYWEPNDAQLSQLMDGPRVNDRGSKTKSLKGSMADGWRSTGRRQTRSAMIVGYQENWTVAGLLDGTPLFMREDMMGTGIGRQQDAEGQTLYQVTSLGTRVTGTYERDGIRHGSFFMIKTPHPRGLKKKEGSVNERFQRRSFEEGMRRFQEEQQGGEEADE